MWKRLIATVRNGADRKLGRLANWPRVMPSDFAALLRESLELSTAVFQAPRVLLAWEEPDEPWLRLATLRGRELIQREESPTTYEPLVAEKVWGLNFFCEDVRGSRPAVTWLTSAGPQQESFAALHPGLQKDFEIGSVLCLKIDGETVQGHLLMLDLPRISIEDLTVGEIMGGLIASRMDQLSYRLAQREAVNEERIRVARDLHDGLLQSFTGVVLQLETVHEILEREPDEARRLITQLQGVMMSDQRELRAYVDELRPLTRRPVAEFDFHGRLAELRERFRNEWRLNVDYQIGNLSPLVADSLGHETFRLILEALTNSAKHGQASNVHVHLDTAGDRLHITVADDGVGFPFRGRYNLEALNAMHQTPDSLGGRVASLNGEMVIDSTDSGATLEITVPLGIGA